MAESMKSSARLEVSVSFGRFEKDALSWEKWSSFSPNKYLEEAGNLSTPGSVAQKKAYFEAHYKKIAAKKAEELEQEKLMDPIVLSPDISRKEDCVENSYETDCKFGLSNGERLMEEVSQEASATLWTNGAISDEAEDDNNGSCKGDVQGTCMNGSINAITLEEKNEDAAVSVECESSAIEEAKDEINGNVEGPQLNVGKDSPLIGSETPQKDSKTTLDKLSGRKNGIKHSGVSNKGNSKLDARNIARKGTQAKKESTLAGTKKKVVSPSVKVLQASTAKYSKQSSMPTLVSASKTLKKQVNGLPLQKSKNSLVGGSKRAAPTSMHMSLSLGSANSLAGISMTRKSLIMEKMGDKDIVRRAFKTFQNRSNGSTTDEKPTPVEHMSPVAFESKISTSRTPTKRNERPRKDSENRDARRSQSGTRSNPLPKGLHKSSALDGKNMISLSPTTGLRSDEKSEKRKEFLKKLEAKSIARNAENSQLTAKSEVHEIRQCPAFSR